MIKLVVVSLIGLILGHEYSDWATRSARWMVVTAARFHSGQDRMRDEWLAELDTVRREPTEAQGLVFAGSLFVRYVVTVPFRLIDPTDVDLFLVAVIIVGPRPEILVPQLVLLVFLGFVLHRRHLTKLPPGETIAPLFTPVSSRFGIFVLTFLKLGVSGYWFWTAASRGSTIRWIAAFALATWIGMVAYSPHFQAVLMEWRRHRVELIDPRL